MRWRGMNTILPGFISGFNMRKLSQTRRLARLRTTARMQNFLPHITPACKFPVLLGAAAATSKAPAAERPDIFTASKSDLSVSLSLFSRRYLIAGTLSPDRSIIQLLRRKLGAALHAAAFEDQTTTFGGHTGHKAQATFSSAVRRLIGSFHDIVSLFFRFNGLFGYRQCRVCNN